MHLPASNATRVPSSAWGIGAAPAGWRPAIVRGLAALVMIAVMPPSLATASDAIRYDSGEIKFYCMQVAVENLTTGGESRKLERFMLMYFPRSRILQGADQFVADYRQGSMTASVHQPDRLTASFTSQKGAQSYAGTVTIAERHVGDEYDGGKEPIPLQKIPLSFVFNTTAEGDGQRESLRYKGFCSQPKYENPAGVSETETRIEPGCFMSNGEKFCK